MKKVLKWTAIVFAGLFIIGVIVDKSKSPEEKAAEKFASQEREAEEEAEKQAKSDAKAAEKQAKAQAKLAAQAQALDALPTITAEQLAEEYEANTVAADLKFKGKQFKISGKVSDINTDFRGHPYVTMGGTNQFMQPQFAFDKDATNQLAEVKKGMKLTLVCEGRGDIAKTPMSNNCQILQ